jgi:hypothetical protein
MTDLERMRNWAERFRDAKTIALTKEECAELEELMLAAETWYWDSVESANG